MRILVDADACPVVDLARQVAQKFELDLLIFFDISHQLTSSYGQLIRVDRADQSVDMAIFNSCQEDDIVITQDYGLAALVLGKKARVLNQNGKIFTDSNIDYLLMRRHIYARIRRAGGRHRNQKKRRKEQDDKFLSSLLSLIKKGEEIGR